MPLNFGYAGVLRCIGQASQKQTIDIFELKSYADEFRLQAGDPNPPYIALIEMRFSIAQIEVLDREGKMRRGQSNAGSGSTASPKYFAASGDMLIASAGSCCGLTTAMFHCPTIPLCRLNMKLGLALYSRRT